MRLGLLALLALPSTASAGTLTVCASGCDHTTVTAAVAAASSGDTITIASGTFNGALTIDKDLTLIGAGSGTGGTVLSRSSSGPVVTVDGVTVVLEALAVTAGTGRRGILAQSGADLTLERVRVHGITRTDSGAGILANDATLTIVESTFQNNKVTGATSNGAHIAAFGTPVTVLGSTFTTGTADGSGGALYVSGASFAITGSTFTDNASTGASGGAVWAGNGADGTIEDSVFEANDASASGGAVRWIDGPSGSLRITGSVFDANGAAHGGAIAARDAGTLELVDNLLSHNTASAEGGGLYLDGTDSVEATRNLVCRNDAADAGGGASLRSTGAVANDWNNNLFVENDGGVVGGGIASADTSTGLVLVHNDFLGNAADEGGGLFAGDAFVFVNNLVAWTAAGDGVRIDAGVTPVAFDHNGWRSNTAGHVGGGSLGGSDVTADPELQGYVFGDGCLALGSYWRALGSPMLDAGDATWGGADPDGSDPDIGAFGGALADPASWTDADGDGFVAMWDCDDEDDGINPGAEEVCNGVDDDCNGEIDDDATDAVVWYRDADGDGYGDPEVSTTACTAPAGYVADGTDCDDTRSTVNPGMPEICNDIDDNCDGEIDVDAVDATPWYRDADGDGFGDPESSVTACTRPDGYVDNALDCDDTDDAVNPDADELCNGIDDDCDGEIDENDAIDALTWYRDLDRDGWGDPDFSVRACSEPFGYTDRVGDCDDTNPDVHPDAREQCDDLDRDCDGDPYNDVVYETWYRDEDGDGFGNPDESTEDCRDVEGHTLVPGDCDDEDPTINPDAVEIWYDGIDQDCDGHSDFDQDFDGHDADAYGGDDCDDLDPTVHPGATEIPDDGIDQDCDGMDLVSQNSRKWTAPDSEPVGAGCACATGSSPPPAFGGLLLLGLAGLRRRR